MRLAAYAGASTALAAGVVIYAFNQRANFYSACVYLSQSNLCLMILTNLILFIIASLMFGLQRIFYGPLRPIEIEQLYEKAWFAVTETCLAMTIFREEVGAWFLVMFVALLAGKVWGWIGDGRVEILEQQPPTNPRLVHIRLSLSLAISLVYDMWVLGYTISTVIQQARPNMMVMFLFEFAILTTSSYSTALRYVISLVEARIVKKQTKERLELRRREVREEREELLRQRATAAAANEAGGAAESTQDSPALPSEDDVDEMDIEVPGWEAKGQWVLSLDLITDFFKLGIYTTFFFILLTFYGLPIHIMRDLFLTARSFIKRLTAFLRYRKAIKDMNTRYPDASAEEIQREDTCIICREEMRPWSVTNPPETPVAPADGAAVPPTPPRPRPTPLVNERSRPKKLPCGHVLHLGCLKSWLERQQMCPTCRRPVVDNARPSQGQPQPRGQGAQGPGIGQPGPAGALPNAAGQQPAANANVRMINIGPLRFAFGQANNMQDFAQRFPAAQPGQQNAGAAAPRVYGLEFGFPRLQPQPQGAAPAANAAGTSIQTQLRAVEQQVMQQLLQLQLNQNELQIIQQLQAQLVRVRSMREPNNTGQATAVSSQLPQILPVAPMGAAGVPLLQQHAPTPGTSPIPSGSVDLPQGLTIPEGWSLVPLQQVEQTAIAATPINSMLSQLVAPHTTPSNGTSISHVETTPIPPPHSIVPPPPGSVFRDAIQAAAQSTPNHTDRPEQSHPNIASATNGISPQNTEGLSSPLPNRGSSQLYRHLTTRNPERVNNTALSPEPPVLPASEVPSSSAPTANRLTNHAENGEVTGGESKGKAKAATVEDTSEDS